MRSTTNSSSRQVRNRVSFGAVLFSLVLAVFVLGSAALASGITAPSDGPLAQATNVPQGVGTSQVPDAVATGGAPPAIQTGEPPDAQLTANAAIPGNQNNNSAPGSNTTSSNPSPGGGGSSFPWLLVLLVVVVVVLLVLAFFLMRSRRSTLVVASGPAMTPPPTPPVAPMSTGTSTTTMSTTTTSPTVAAVTPAATTAATAAALPRTLTCPNCSTVNDWSENFCHECGQDLRPLRASIVAAAAPPADIVTDDMPYLETLDRSDDQLEYVLSRKKIVVGSAPGNDIVIDASFKGNDTVSPKHAELRREGDGFLLVDLNSENGTYVNDARTGENLLSAGDEIRFGSVRFVYRVP